MFKRRHKVKDLTLSTQSSGKGESELYHRITTLLKLEGTSRSCNSSPWSSRATYTWLHRIMSRQLLNISKDEDFTTPLGNPYHCSVTFTVKKCSLMFRLNHLYLSLCPFPLFLSLDTTGSSLFPPFFQPCLYRSKIPNELSPLQAEQFQFSQPFLIWEVLQPLNHFNDPSLESWCVSLVLSNAKLDRAFQVWSHQVLSMGEGLHPLTSRHHS